MIAGELGLSREIKPVRGILPMALEAKKQGLKRCIVPLENLAEAQLVEGKIKILGAGCLIQLIELLQCRDGVPENLLYKDIMYMEKQKKYRRRQLIRQWAANMEKKGGPG